MILPEVAGNGFVWRLDPRTRVLLSTASALILITVTSIPALITGLLLFLAIALTSFGRRMPWRRFVLLNALMAGFIMALPWSVRGETLFSIGPLAYTREGLATAASIALRANAIVLSLTAFLGTMDPVTLGHAFTRLRVPSRLVQLLLFTVRYITVLETEYAQLRRAMALRGFEPRLNAHTLRAYGNLIGMLLVRALDRSERIYDAMRCRAFNGVFPTTYPFRFGVRDGVFCALFVAVLAGLLGSDWYLG